MELDKRTHLPLGETKNAPQTSTAVNLTDLNMARRYVHEVISGKSLQIVYQPIVDHVHHIVVGHEALSRPHVQGKPIKPDALFQAAYDCERSSEVDILALTAAVKIAQWQEVQFIPLFVNVMPSSLMDKAYLGRLESLMASGACRPEQLVIEITEHVSYDPSSLRTIVNQIRSLGVRIALDDVGVGEANLRALVDLEPDFAKVDRSLIHGISKSSSKQRLLSHLVGFMESGNSVIAEGLEDSEDLPAIQEAGVNLSQGYFWAHPMPSEYLASFITKVHTERNVLKKVAYPKGGRENVFRF